VSAAAERLSLERRALLSAGGSMFTTAELPEIGLRAVRMADGPMGVTSGRVDERDIALLTPCGTALAASWDRASVREVGALLGMEARRAGVDVLLAPNLNLPRSPLGGRAFEQFSEDPFLTGVLGAAWIEGVQSQGVGTAPKHLVGNDSETDRHSMNSVIDERALREVYLLPFEHAADAGAWLIMTSYNRVNGIWTAEHGAILRDVVRDAWAFDGVIVSDWFGTHDTLGSARGGLDLEMPGPGRQFGPALARAVAEGRLDEAEVDERFTRVRALVARSQAGRAIPVGPRTGTERDLLRRAAAAGFVLVRNDRALLPLEREQHVALIGPNAVAPCLQGGTFARISLEPGVRSPAEALADRFATVTVAEGAVADVPLPSPRPLQPRTDDGEPGLLVEYVAADGTVVGSEVRDTNLLVWFEPLPGLSAPAELEDGARVRMRGWITPQRDGAHEFLVAGTGAITLAVDGAPVVEGGSRAAPADVMGALLHGEISAGTQPLTAGVPVRLDVEMRLGVGRAQGMRFGVRPPAQPDLLQQAIAAAAQADTAVVVVGESQDASLESADRTTTHLAADQERLVRSVCAANPRTVVVINAAHAIDLACAKDAAAVLFAWYPGQEFGPALADVLAGELEPGGRMPVVVAVDEADYPAFDLTPDASGDLRYEESVLIGQRWLDARGIAPAVPLGHGLGYTEFRYDHARVRPADDGSIEVDVTITNVGARAGKEVVQVYVAAPDGPVPRPVQQLGGFAALEVAAGETITVTVAVPRRATEWWDPERQAWRRSPGAYELRVGRSSHDIRLRAAYEVADGSV
jgi:beta-glucosidase